MCDNCASGSLTAPTKSLNFSDADAAANAARREFDHKQLVAETANQVLGLSPSLEAGLKKFGHLNNRFMRHQGFWPEDKTFGDAISLIMSELGEAVEAFRLDAPSEKIPGFSGVEEELADTLIRILDLAAQKGLRVSEAMTAKTLYNLSRPYRHGGKKI